MLVKLAPGCNTPTFEITDCQFTFRWLLHINSTEEHWVHYGWCMWKCQPYISVESWGWLPAISQVWQCNKLCHAKSGDICYTTVRIFSVSTNIQGSFWIFQIICNFKPEIPMNIFYHYSTLDHSKVIISFTHDIPQLHLCKIWVKLRLMSTLRPKQNSKHSWVHYQHYQHAITWSNADKKPMLPAIQCHQATMCNKTTQQVTGWK